MAVVDGAVVEVAEVAAGEVEVAEVASARRRQRCSLLCFGH